MPRAIVARGCSCSTKHEYWCNLVPAQRHSDLSPNNIVDSRLRMLCSPCTPSTYSITASSQRSGREDPQHHRRLGESSPKHLSGLSGSNCRRKSELFDTTTQQMELSWVMTLITRFTTLFCTLTAVWYLYSLIHRSEQLHYHLDLITPCLRVITWTWIFASATHYLMSEVTSSSASTLVIVMEIALRAP